METNWDSAAPPPPGTRTGGRIEQALNPEATGKGREIKLFGEDGFTFFDFLDIINPLQHIPFVATLYRKITGDEIDPGARIAGATLFGGPVGLAVSALDVMIEQSTGKYVGDHVLAFLGDDAAPQTPPDDAPEPVQVALARPEDYAAMDKNKPVALAAPALGEAAGMTAIPIAKETFTSPKYARWAAPDLQLLGDMKTAPVATPDPAPSPAPTPSPTKATPAAGRALPQAESLARFETGAGNASAGTAKPFVTLLGERGNGWVYAAMLQALDKYEDGSRLAKQPLPAGISVTR